MNKTKINHLLDKNDNLVGIEVETRKETFVVPVVDVRLGDSKRRKANQILKDANIKRGSKFMKQTFSLWGYKYN